MKVLCAPDSFKESISAKEAAMAMGEGARRCSGVGRGVEVDVCPVADGGEGTMEAIVSARGGAIHAASVVGPMGERVEARYAVLDDGLTGVVELAEASGLALLPGARRDPMRATTFGTGELIRRSMERGCREVIVCIGGSATVDGGSGIAQAMGAVFYDERDEAIEEPMAGGMLERVSRVEPPGVEGLPRIRIACDVTNPLCGASGAAAVYGPQKGATAEQVRALDAGLAHLAAVLDADASAPGFGAAGGAALCMVTLCGAAMERGIDLVLETLRFDERCSEADLVLTGEGSLDAQSLHGKATIGVARAAARFDVPVIALVGRAGEGAEKCIGPGLLSRYVSISERYGMEPAMREPGRCLAEIAAEVVGDAMCE